MITQEHINQILLIPYIFIVISLIAGVFTYHRQNFIQRLVFILVVITAFVELASKILWYQKINNLPLFHFYAVIEFSIILLIYEWSYQKSISSRSGFRYLIYFMVIFAILNGVFFQGLLEFNSNVITLSAFILTFFSLLYYYKLLKEVKHLSLERQPMFWINTGVLIYFSSSLVFFLASNVLASQSIEVRGIVWGTHAIFNVFHYITFTIALWVKPNK